VIFIASFDIVVYYNSFDPWIVVIKFIIIEYCFVLNMIDDDDCDDDFNYVDNGNDGCDRYDNDDGYVDDDGNSN